MLLTLIIIFSVGLLLGLAAGIPALKRRSSSVEIELYEYLDDYNDELFSEYVDTDLPLEEYEQGFSDDPDLDDEFDNFAYENGEVEVGELVVDEGLHGQPTDEIPATSRPEPERIGGRLLLGPGAPRTTAYDEKRCREFVSALGDDVLQRAGVMFQVLKDRGHVDSISLAKALDSAPARLGGILTARLKRRASDLGVELPYDAKRADGRTTWRDHSGIAGRMVTAIREERATRAREARSGAAGLRKGL